MRTGGNEKCRSCAKVHMLLRGWWCSHLDRLVEYCDTPPCETTKTINLNTLKRE